MDCLSFNTYNNYSSRFLLTSIFPFRKTRIFFSSIPNVIIDSEKYSGHGPVSGLLSCKEKFKGRAILYIGCDYPLLLPEDILKLVSDTTSTCAFYIDQYEPILAFYSVESLDLLEKNLNPEMILFVNFLTISKR